MKRCLLVALLLLFATSAYAATHVIRDDMGGEVLSFIAKYTKWRDAGDNVRIEGECDSACTMVLGIVESDKICATRNAEFGFHSASVLFSDGHQEYSREATELLWYFYQDRTRRMLVQHGWTEPSIHPDMLFIDAQEIVKPCNAVINKP